MTFLELLHLIRKHIKLMVLLPILCAAVAAALSWFILPDTYTASTTLYVFTKSSQGGSSDSISNTDLTASQMLTDDVAKLIASGRVKGDTAQALNLPNLDGFAIDVSSETTTRLITVSVTSTSAELVALVANELAKDTDAVAREAMDVQSINVIEEAVAPGLPSGPPRALYTIVAFFIGALGAIAIIMIMDIVGTPIRNAKEAADLLGLPIIGRVPEVKGKLRRAMEKNSNKDPKLVEMQNAVKTLYANIGFMSSSDVPLKSLVITSSIPNEGKSTVALNLAESIADSGKRVVLVEVDMRGRSLKNMVKAGVQPGTYAVLAGAATLDEAIKSTSSKGLYFLDVEPNIPNPADLLSSNNYKKLVCDLEKRFDYVIFDTPPVATFVDAAILSTMVDGVILVVRTDLTKYVMLEEAYDQLMKANANILGICATFTKGTGADYYYVYYNQSGQRISKSEPDHQQALIAQERAQGNIKTNYGRSSDANATQYISEAPNQRKKR